MSHSAFIFTRGCYISNSTFDLPTRRFRNLALKYADGLGTPACRHPVYLALPCRYATQGLSDPAGTLCKGPKDKAIKVLERTSTTRRSILDIFEEQARARVSSIRVLIVEDFAPFLQFISTTQFCMCSGTPRTREESSECFSSGRE